MAYYEGAHGGGGGGGGGGDYHMQREAPQRVIYDGKRMRKAITRRTVDFNSTVLAHLEHRIIQKHERDVPVVQPWPSYIRSVMPSSAYEDNPITSMCTKFVHTSINKMRCPINVAAWTPEGRRLITGASSGEFTLWNGLTFNFETILQAHDTAVRAMVWSHNENWMVTGDHGGTVKYWQSNMNNAKAFQAHNEAVRDISFCPTDLKFATCSDDVTIKIWDFARCEAEKTLQGHGGDVKCISWHPLKSLLVSGSKDSFIKVWDARNGKNITTLHGHKNTVMSVRCNKNGNWLLSCSRDQLIKIFDLRMMKEMHTYRGHKREVTTVSWHPHHEDFFSSGAFDGTILFWTVGSNEPAGEIIGAHDSSVWDLAWHPLGHILCSGSNDHTTKFWCRNRPGDTMKDKYNVRGGTEVADAPEGPGGHGVGAPSIPGLGAAIPGLGAPASAGAPSMASGMPSHMPPVASAAGGGGPPMGMAHTGMGGPPRPKRERSPDRRGPPGGMPGRPPHGMPPGMAAGGYRGPPPPHGNGPPPQYGGAPGGPHGGPPHGFVGGMPPAPGRFQPGPPPPHQLPPGGRPPQGYPPPPGFGGAPPPHHQGGPPPNWQPQPPPRGFTGPPPGGMPPPQGFGGGPLPPGGYPPPPKGFGGPPPHQQGGRGWH